MSTGEREREPDRLMIAVAHLQGAIRRGATWDESHYSAVEQVLASVSRLREERDEAREALGEITQQDDQDPFVLAGAMRRIARAALAAASVPGQEGADA